MKNTFNIGQFYQPVQPAVKQKSQDVTYREFAPDKSLQNLIYCYWELKSEERLQNPFMYRVIADGCIDIFFRLDDSSENFVMGLCKNYTEFPLGNNFHYAGIRFLPTMFSMLYKMSAKELINRFERLEMVVKDSSEFITNHLSGRDDIRVVKEKLDAYFIYLMRKSNMEMDPRFQNALNIILKEYGVVNIQADLDIGLSPRQLRRYFEFYIGASAKTFSQIVRFQNSLNANLSTLGLKRNNVFYDLGYYDQAHFIKEFKRFYGITPTKALDS
ncbi:MAG: AraC family transcriptional regulator [Balneolaceae bacterium]|nr:AraC family transcriptional regulator [Balneolaceae bacterium]